MFPLLALAVSCSLGDEGAPAELEDGSPARTVPVELEGVDRPTVLTRARVVPVEPLPRESPAAACVRGRARGARIAGVAVERVGVSSESVTLREASSRALIGCDDSPGSREGGRRWCGAAYGLLAAGRLRDPRLSILCTTGDGKPIAFVWVQPRPATRYVAVAQDGFVEVYETAGDLPVRVSTAAGVDLERSSAEFAVTEHDASGALIRGYELRAVVAG